MKPVAGIAVVIAALLTITTSFAAQVPADDAIALTWARTDAPVATGVATRTWMWGPSPISDGLYENYDEAPGATRLVQYFDKSRMEITYPYGDRNAAWYVSNGLLATELITGEMQVGDQRFVDIGAAEVPVAGDVDDAFGPTYATFTNKRYVPLGYPDEVITTRIERDGSTWDDPGMATYNVQASTYVIETNHRVASVFWGFMNAYGPVFVDGEYKSDDLFANPFYAVGLPITEAYWASVKVGGVYRDVLMQCFERRCLTYTPGNPNGFEVEAGNIGLHYYLWRYGELPVVYQ